MRKLVYLLVTLESILLVLGLCHSCRENSNTGLSSMDTVVVVDPFEVNGDYSSLPNYDSINKVLRADAYNWYGDSDATGLPDSLLARKDSIERLRE